MNFKIMKYGILLLEGLTKENALLFDIVTVPAKELITVVLEEKEIVTDKLGQSQKRVTQWATGKIVEWKGVGTKQLAAIEEAKGLYNSGRVIKITSQQLIL